MFVLTLQHPYIAQKMRNQKQNRNVIYENFLKLNIFQLFTKTKLKILYLLKWTKICNLINVRPYFHDMTIIYFHKYLYKPQKLYVKCHSKSKTKAPHPTSRYIQPSEFQGWPTSQSQLWGLGCLVWYLGIICIGEHNLRLIFLKSC